MYWRAERGFLSNPYKKVFILGGDPGLPSGGFAHAFFENRPERRNQGMILLHGVRYVDLFDAALHLEYRFNVDDWQVHAHTFEIDWYQPLGQGWQLVPRFRYYSQDQAEFYRPVFSSPRKDGRYSSDYRLAGFGALSAGVSLETLIGQRLTLRTGFEYYQRRAGLKLGGQSRSGFADFSSILITAAFQLTF